MALLEGLTRLRSSLCKRGVALNRRSANSEANPLSPALSESLTLSVSGVPIGVVEGPTQLAFHVTAQAGQPRLYFPTGHSVPLEFGRLVPYPLGCHQFPG